MEGQSSTILDLIGSNQILSCPYVYVILLKGMTDPFPSCFTSTIRSVDIYIYAEEAQGRNRTSDGPADGYSQEGRMG